MDKSQTQRRTGYQRVEGNRRASRNGPVSDLPPEIPIVTIRLSAWGCAHTTPLSIRHFRAPHSSAASHAGQQEAPGDVPYDFSDPARVRVLVRHLRTAMQGAAPVPRFVALSPATQHAILRVLRGLCREDEPLGVAAALALLNQLLGLEGGAPLPV
jgi:hypothetical protein